MLFECLLDSHPEAEEEDILANLVQYSRWLHSIPRMIPSLAQETRTAVVIRRVPGFLKGWKMLKEDIYIYIFIYIYINQGLNFVKWMRKNIWYKIPVWCTMIITISFFGPPHVILDLGWGVGGITKVIWMQWRRIQQSLQGMKRPEVSRCFFVRLEKGWIIRSKNCGVWFGNLLL